MAETSGSNNKTKGKKRARTERDAGDEPGKRARTEPVSEKNPVASTSGATTPAPNVQKPSEPKKAVKRERRIVKLVPPRPFPTVAAGANATGPRSALSEGKNMICITRRTELGAYLRRCKELVLQDG